MNWSRENPRYRRSSAQIRRKKKKSLFHRLDRWWQGRKKASGSEVDPDKARHRPDPPVPPQLMDELKIAVPRPKEPKPQPAPRVCPPPQRPDRGNGPQPSETAGAVRPKTVPHRHHHSKSATAVEPAEALAADPPTFKAGRKRARRATLEALKKPLREAPPEPEHLADSPSSFVESETRPLTGAPSPAAPDETDADVFWSNSPDDLEDPGDLSGRPETKTELYRPDGPEADHYLTEEADTVASAAVELDLAEIKTIPASIYRDRGPAPVHVVGPADEAAEEAEVPLEAQAVSDDQDPREPEAAAPLLTDTPRREDTVEHRKSSRSRRKSRVRSALDSSSALRWGLIAGLIGLLAVGLGLGWSYFSRPVTPTAKVARIPVANLPKVLPLTPGFYEIYARQRVSAVQTEATIAQGSGLGQALEEVGLGARQKSAAIIECLSKEGGVNPNAVRAGVTLKAFWADRGRNELRRLEYHPETGAAPLVVMPRADGGFWLYNTASPPLTLSAAREGQVESSLWQAGSDAGLDASVILTLSDILASDVDFFNDIKQGDSFQVLYSREYRDGRPQGVPVIDMVKLVNKGRSYEYYRFVGPNDKVGYYDPEGRTSHKAFFVTPLQYKRISSNFTMKRMHPIHRVVRPHQGVDYAAPSGTPISSVADGTVVFADWNGGYGRLVTIKHDETYTTMYAHMSRFAPGIKKGVKVKQGDLIGYVGATGTATGPHLDFRLKKNGTFIDPVPELAKQQGRKLESGDFIDLTKVIGLTRDRMKEQLAAINSGV